VRSIARDLGQVLGCFAHVRSLRRIWSGPFDAEDALSFDQLDAMAKSSELDAHVLPLESALSDLPELRATAEGCQRLRNGNPGMVLATDLEYGDVCWASYEGRAVAIGRYKSGELHPTRVLLQN
jgi:tRNA pseudouridine55 synthase